VYPFDLKIPAERISSGIGGLDSMIEGGFLKGSFILLGGSPGTGKTEFATKFLCEGIAGSKEAVKYVSFSERREQYLSDMKQRDPDAARYVADKRFRFYDLPPLTAKGLSVEIESILKEVIEHKVSRLVIDSYSAIEHAFKDQQEARAFLEILLRRIARRQGCTTILISEQDKYGGKTEFGMEEFAADCVVWLEATQFRERFTRSLEIIKMRGTRLAEKRVLYTLEGGFVVFPQTNHRPSQIPGRPAKTTPSQGLFSTGIPDVDSLLGGGLLPGSLLLLSSDDSVTTDESNLFTGAAITSFLAKGDAVAVVPPPGEGVLGADTYVGQSSERKAWTEKIALFVPSENIPPGAKARSSVVKLQKMDIEGSTGLWTAKLKEITDDGRIHLLTVVSARQLYAMFGDFVQTLGPAVSALRSAGNVLMYTLSPGLPFPHIYEEFRTISDYHLRLCKKDGALLLYGIKPRTNLYVVEFQDTPERPVPSLRLVD